MVKHGCRYVELDKNKVFGLFELLAIESYFRGEELGHVIVYQALHRGYSNGYALFHLYVMYEYEYEKSLPCAGLLHLIKSLSEGAVWYVKSIYIPVKHLKERLVVHGFSLQFLDRRYVELEVRLKEGWANPLLDVASVGLNVFYEDLYVFPTPEDF